MKFFFSIIIPVYNTEQYLGRCLDSVASQRFGLEKVQVIVVNDGSPDRTKCNEIITSFKKKLQIDYIKFDENMGTHVARKKGVEATIGEYLFFIDADDYLEKDALSALHQDIQKNGDADYIEFNFFQLRYGYLKIKDSFLLPRDANINVIDVKTRDGGHHWEIFNKCFKTSFAKLAYRNMSEDYIVFSEDFYQTCILDYFAKNRRILQKYLYVYVIGTGITAEQVYSKEKLKKIVLSLFNIEKHLSSFYKKEGQQQYIEILRQYTIGLYLWFMERSKLDDFIECCKEILDEPTLENLLLQYLGRTSSEVRAIKKQNKLSLMFAKLKRYLKRRFRR